MVEPLTSDPDGVRPEPPVAEHQHRDVRGGAARAAVFGVSDGLVSNVGLILGVAGADPAPSVVRVAGLAGLVAGAISMAAGEYNSMRVQAELFEREVTSSASRSGATPTSRWPSSISCTSPAAWSRPRRGPSPRR